MISPSSLKNPCELSIRTGGVPHFCSQFGARCEHLDLHILAHLDSVLAPKAVGPISQTFQAVCQEFQELKLFSQDSQENHDHKTHETSYPHGSTLTFYIRCNNRTLPRGHRGQIPNHSKIATCNPVQPNRPILTQHLLLRPATCDSQSSHQDSFRTILSVL